mmetsp:Transcript_98568/g.279335  ORF Transcript_98568/g.279335 Transcript_98568/m.279335 type:complete len:229 (+) Transcript_98568:114-800(+)
MSVQAARSFATGGWAVPRAFCTARSAVPWAAEVVSVRRPADGLARFPLDLMEGVESHRVIPISCPAPLTRHPFPPATGPMDDADSQRRIVGLSGAPILSVRRALPGCGSVSAASSCAALGGLGVLAAGRGWQGPRSGPVGGAAPAESSCRLAGEKLAMGERVLPRSSSRPTLSVAVLLSRGGFRALDAGGEEPPCGDRLDWGLDEFLPLGPGCAEITASSLAGAGTCR